MNKDKIDIIQSSSSGTVGRAVSRTRGQALILDSSTHPRDDALTNAEAFLAGISSCGVTLIEGYAQEQGVPVEGMNVTIEGVRPAADSARFERISMTFELAGVSRAKAEELVEVYRHR